MSLGSITRLVKRDCSDTTDIVLKPMLLSRDNNQGRRETYELIKFSISLSLPGS